MADRKNYVTFEEALEKAGYGVYNYVLTAAMGLITIAFVTVSYGTTILVPASACELETTVTQRGLLAAGPVVGLIIGGSLWGVLADRYGRRLMLCTSLVSAAVVNAVGSISVNWVMLLCMQFLASLLASGLFSQSMTMLSESVPMARRNFVVLIVSCFSLLSQGLMSVLAIPIIPLSYSIHLPSLNIYWNSWRTLMLVYSIPSLISAVWIFYMQESPKFLFAKGREQEALEVLKRIHRFNKGSSEIYEVEGILKETIEKQPTSISEQILPLFKWPLLKNTLIMTCLFAFQQISSFLIWLPTIANEFIRIVTETGTGNDLTLCNVLNMSLHTEPDPDTVPCSLNVTAMLIVFGVGALHSVFNLFVSLIINRVGRRNIVMVITAVCGICGVAVNLVPNVIGSGILFMIFLIGIVVIGLYAAMAVALFPTYLRVFAVALTMTGGRISTFATVQILNLLLVNNCEASFYIFGTIFASSALFAAMLVDDRKIIKNLVTTETPSTNE